MTTQLIKIVMLFFVVTLIASCSMFSPIKTEPTTEYVISRIPCTVAKKPHRRIVLLVHKPSTNPLYNSSKMAYSTQAYQIGFFVKSRWAEPPAEMLQPLMIQTLQNSHYFYAVNSSLAMGSYNYVLNTQIVKLQQTFFANCSYVHFVVRAQIVNASTNRIIAVKEFSFVEPARELTPYGGVVATNKAAAKFLQQLTRFCVNTLR